MHYQRSLACGAALVALLAAAGSAAAQTRPVAGQIDSLQGQIQSLQQQLQSLRTQVTATQAQSQQAQSDAQAARASVATVSASAPANAPHITFSANNRPGWESADGQNSIAITGRLHLDAGTYVNYKPDSKFTTPQNLNSGINARRARLGVLGKFAGDWNYAFIYDFGGSSDGLPPTSGAPSSGIENAELSYTGFKPIALDLGYMDTPYTLDEATSSNDIMFIERSSAQAIATSIAAGDSRSAAGIRSNDSRYWAGAYVTGPTSGASHVTGEPLGAFGRFSYQLLQTPQYSLHVGVDAEGLLKGSGDPQTLTLSDRPELRIDPTSILTTGTLGSATNPLTSAHVLSGELAAGYGSAYLQGEYFHYSVNRQGLKSANFNGGYLQASYTLTGEHRTYIPATGAYSAISPAQPFSLKNGTFGAFEIGARYSEIDLDSNYIFGAPAGGSTAAVNGGDQTVYTVGLNWYPNNNIRFMLDYLHGTVSKQNGVVPASAGAATLGTSIGAAFDAIALRTQIAF